MDAWHIRHLHPTHYADLSSIIATWDSTARETCAAVGWQTHSRGNNLLSPHKRYTSATTLHDASSSARLQIRVAKPSWVFGAIYVLELNCNAHTGTTSIATVTMPCGQAYQNVASDDTMSMSLCCRPQTFLQATDEIPISSQEHIGLVHGCSPKCLQFDCKLRW